MNGNKKKKKLVIKTKKAKGLGKLFIRRGILKTYRKTHKNSSFYFLGINKKDTK
ncbi:Hypothetical protein Minf_1706 [Methylacidiphilum infernorum V4]|uniref:Uncharacterized protein n=1 Tax=Methylacidiphilum infernorum (isolate V4) TaxID=481448 RepID=B3DWU7_METI4|nr:Hypothetical protein Minf_1706 [Methylacidiphilum infernorum V4]